jgi:hypothetical protein
MKAKAKNNRRSRRQHDEDMDDEELEDVGDIQTRVALVLKRAIRSIPFSSSIWAAHILNAVRQTRQLIGFI